jgi:hypothetical protein
MPIDTPLSGLPYSDDYNEEKDFYRILFKPGVSVQTRELNQLQAILSKQIERFGENIFKRGTIVDGCNFTFKSPYPYVKLQDADINGDAAVVSQYVGLFAQNANNHKAYIMDYQDGFETTAPDLRTIYVNYINSGDSGDANAYSPGDTLTIFDGNNSIFKVKVNGGGVGFSNSDKMVFSPAVVVKVASGTFSNGDYVTQPDLGSNLQIISVDTTTLALQGQVILGLKPRDIDLANALASSTMWTVANNASIRNATNTVTGTIKSVLGAGAEGGILTDASGKITTTIVTQRGNGYANVPWVGVRSANNLSGITASSLTAQNWLAQVKVANTAGATGNGYAFGVTEGVIFHKGYFLRVEPQTVIVSKYNQSPNNVVVGFNTVEDIIDYNIDETLRDPVPYGSENSLAPGADRLRLTPTLLVTDKASIDSSNSFLSIVEWSEGNPYKQNQVTEYSRIGDEMARRTKEEAGDFVIDRFLVTTRSPSDPTLEGTSLDVVIDPGKAYVSGYRVETTRNDVITVSKGLDTLVTNTQYIPLFYGDFIRVKEVGGVFQFSTGDTIDLRDTAKGFLSNTSLVATSNTVATGNSIGVARISSLVAESGIPGTANAVYQLYLFDVKMNAGKNFRDVKSVAYSGTQKGIADIVLELTPTTNTNVAVLHASSNCGLLFDTGVSSLKNANNGIFVYRTIYQDVSFANTGLLAKSLAANPNEFFTNKSLLNNDQMQDLYVIPIGGDLKEATTRTGTVATLTTSPNVTGTGTLFVSEVAPGDFLYLAGNSTETAIRKIISVVNNTLLIVESNNAFANTAATVRRVFPNSVPIPFGSRVGLSANVNSNGNILTLNLGVTLQGSASVNAALAVDVESHTNPGTKVASRDRFVKLSLANNVASNTGPWSLGIPDAFRLKKVFLGTSSSVSNTNLDVTDDFYIDPNQNENYLNLSALAKRPDSALSLKTSDWLLVQFDHFTITANGYFATPSYLSSNSAQIAVTDSQPLANLSTSIHSAEVPQVFSRKGQRYDLLNTLDFRPTVVNTAVSTANSSLANINPSNTVSFGNTASVTNVIKFPNPASVMSLTTEQYLGRKDSVFVAKDGTFFVMKGKPATSRADSTEPNQPNDTLLLNSYQVPPYPTLPERPSEQLLEILNMRRAADTLETQRFANWRATPYLGQFAIEQNQPSGFTMKDIGRLQRRVENLEYYTALSLLESDIKNRVIPSSVDRSVNRFKFGFFVDDYTTPLYQDVDNSQYRAAILNTELIPSTVSWAVSEGQGGQHSCPYVDYLIVDQNYATLPVANTQTQPSTNCVPTSVSNIQYSYLLRKSGSSAGLTDTRTFKLGNLAQQVRFFVRANVTPCFLTIYQNGVRVAGGTDLLQMEDDDTELLLSDNFPENWFSEFNKDQLQRYRVYITPEKFDYAGVTSWNHDPSLGSDYTVVMRSSDSTADWRYAIQYKQPIENTTCPPPPGDVNPDYRGILRVTTDYHIWNKNAQEQDGKFVVYEPVIRFGEPYDRITSTGHSTARGDNVFGLKPNTYHKMFLEGNDISDTVRPTGLFIGAPIRTDEEGRWSGLIHIYRADFIRDFFYKVKGHMSNNYYTGKLELVAPHSYASCVVSIRKYDFTSTAVGSAGQDFETFYRDLEGGAGGGIGWYTAGFGPNVTDVTTI